MKLLIDTQSIIWFAENNPLMSAPARIAMEDEENDCFVSMATFWEIAIKMNLGKLTLNGLNLSEFMEEVAESGFLTLDIQRDHVLEVGNLPFLHRDPFDRIIIAQAIVEGMVIVSSDATFGLYPVERIW